MAKKDIKTDELPYFKFKPSMWSAGDIQYCTLEAKGYFLDICSFYWQRKCDMMHTELYKKFDKQPLLEELIRQEVIKIMEGQVVIEFLDEQWEEFFYSHKHAVKSGTEGANKRWKKGKYAVKKEAPLVHGLDQKTEDEGPKRPTAPTEGVFFYVGMQLFKTKISEYCKSELKIHMHEFMIQMQPITTGEVLDEMDRCSVGYAFNNHNHVLRTFDSIARQMKENYGKGFRNNGSGATHTKLTYSIPRG